MGDPSSMDERSAATAGPLIRVSDLRVHFPITKGLVFKRRTGTVRAVDGISLEIHRRETLGLVGESGSGKTTLGRSLIRLHRPTAGSIWLDDLDLGLAEGADLQRARRRVQMIFQDPYASLPPRMRVGDIVAEPLVIHRVGTSGERRARVAELLTLVGLRAADAAAYPAQFSGGQRQRVAIARALALAPDLLVADEPVSALDVSIQAQVINLLRRLQTERDLTYLFISHDLAVVRHLCTRVAVMYLGQLVEVAPVTELFASPRHPYTVALLSAEPVPDPAAQGRRNRIVLPGDIPSPASPPRGCRFHTRCWLRQRLGNPEECERNPPPLADVSAGHLAACHFSHRVQAHEETIGALARSQSARRLPVQRPVEGPTT
jgi:oligopeptide transport system ATP-binding protein